MPRTQLIITMASKKLSASFIAVVIMFLLNSCFVRGNNDSGIDCTEMVPSVDYVEHKSLDVPYSLGAKWNGTYDIIVSIISAEGLFFEDFILQARDAAVTDVIIGGFFSTPPHTTRLSCGQHKNNVLESSGLGPVANTTVTWTPAPNYEGQVVFRATVITNNGSYWKGVESAPVSVKQGPGAPVANIFAEEVNTDDHPRGCGVKMGCFGMPSTCLDHVQSCQILVTFTPVEDGVVFNIVGFADEMSWIAVALSSDRKMGDDSVTDCLLTDTGKVVVQQSWNYRSPKRNEVLSNPRQGISEMKGKFVNGTLSCTWKRQLSTKIHKMSFDIAHEKWYLLLARGHTKNGVKKKHHGALASNNRYNLTSVREEKYQDDTVRDHDINHINRYQFQRILVQKQEIIDNYKKYISVLQAKVEYSKKQLLKAMYLLEELTAAPFEEYSKP